MYNFYRLNHITTSRYKYMLDLDVFSDDMISVSVVASIKGQKVTEHALPCLGNSQN